MGKVRNRFDIAADILRVAAGGAGKTRIVYGANLNFTTVRGYLSELVERGLLADVGGLYRATQKGREFVDRYEGLAPMLSPSPR